MTVAQIIRHRLINQQIAATNFKTPAEIVGCLVAMQAQEYAMAKWAIGLRLPGSRDQEVENAFNEGTILRTHLLRPTWHFVIPADIRWLLKLTAPRIRTLTAFRHRELELDKKVIRRSNDIITRSLEGGQQLTRSMLQSALQQKKITTGDNRLSHLLMEAELEGLICSGPRQGKQFTYGLLEERIKPFKPIFKEEALALLTRRYFASRGPATIMDFVNWSGLSVKDAKEGLSGLQGDFIHEKINGLDYLHAPINLPKSKLQTNFLMPDYDEYFSSYKDRSAIMNKEGGQTRSKDFAIASRGGNLPYNRMIIINGKLAGSWQRSFRNNKIEVETIPSFPWNKSQQKAVEGAVRNFKLFYS